MVNNQLKELKEEINELKQFCDEFDPFKEISEKEQQKLDGYEIQEQSDPFAITNQLLLQLENKIEQLERLVKKTTKKKKTLQ